MSLHNFTPVLWLLFIIFVLWLNSDIYQLFFLLFNYLLILQILFYRFMDSSNSNGNNMVDLDDVLEMEQMVSESLTNTNNGNEIRGETSLELVDNNQNLQHQNIENSIRSEYGRNSHIIQGNDEHQLHSYFGKLSQKKVSLFSVAKSRKLRISPAKILHS